MTETGGPGLGEIGRRVQEALGELKVLAGRLQTDFVTKDTLNLVVENIKLTVKSVEDTITAALEEQAKQIKDLEDDKKWLYRTVAAAVFLGLAGLFFSLFQHGPG